MLYSCILILVCACYRKTKKCFFFFSHCWVTQFIFSYIWSDRRGSRNGLLLLKAHSLQGYDFSCAFLLLWEVLVWVFVAFFSAWRSLTNLIWTLSLTKCFHSVNRLLIEVICTTRTIKRLWCTNACPSWISENTTFSTNNNNNNMSIKVI